VLFLKNEYGEHIGYLYIKKEGTHNDSR